MSESSELGTAFSALVTHYMRSVEGFQLASDDRVAAARAFVRESAHFLGMGVDALRFAQEQLEGPYAAVATRVLLTSAEPIAARVVLSAYEEPARRRLPSAQLAVLGRHCPTDAALLEAYARVPLPYRLEELHVALRRATPLARARLRELMEHGTAEEAASALRAAQHWVDPEQLRSLCRPHEAPSLTALEASFQLALSGEQSAASQLEVWTRRPGPAAAQGCRFLALLAWPGAVPSIAFHLASRNPDCIALALQSVRLLGAWALGKNLIDLLSDTQLSPELAEQCGVALADLTGAPLSDAGVEEAAAGDGQWRAGVVLFYTGQLEAYDSALRGWVRPAPLRGRAEPVTLAALVDSLADVGNPELAEAAAYQLRAMTGQDHGYEPAEDLIANIQAIDAWRGAIAAAPDEPAGGWPFHGTLLPAPPSSDA